MRKMDYCYQLFNPSGNVTALILGLEKNGQLRRRAAQKIMEKHPEVEQVGFVSLDKAGKICFTKDKQGNFVYQLPGDKKWNDNMLSLLRFYGK